MEKAGAIGPEFERMTKLGNLAPDLWMTEATGAPVGPEALLAEAEKALAALLAAPAFASSASVAKEVIPFMADDYPGALATARARNKPIFLEAWAPW
jgi:hypothetical protein